MKALRVGLCGGAAALAVVWGAESLQTATANGDTRTISFHHIHLKEDTTVTFKVNGKYDQAALKKISHALRDWRTGNPIDMDPHLIDALWEVYRDTGAKEPIHVIGGYRSPATNAMLRRRSSGVAKFSQHMLGKAIDFYIPDVSLESIRDAGLRVQRGGVGFYPSSGAPFVHMDVGGVRHWPRVPEAQLARIMSTKGPATRLASNTPAAQKAQKARPAVVASRSARDEDEDAEVVARPSSRRVASVAPQVPAPQQPPQDTIASILAAVPMPKSRPGTAEPAPAPQAEQPARASGFSLASASSQPVRLPAARPEARQEARPTPAPAAEAAPSGGFSLASANSQHVPAPRPAQAASLAGSQPALPSANAVISERGYWQGLVEKSERPVPPAEIPEARPAAVAEAPITGSVGGAAPWPIPDRAAGALAYAPPNTIVDNRPGQAAKARVVSKLSPEKQKDTGIGTNGGTAKHATRSATAKVGDRFNNPWMRAMIVSPSALDFMHTSLYGAPDTASLRPHLAKPAATVMMTFSDDPYLGMSSEQFRGNAVVFVATVTFRQRTAALR
ncbi:MAG: DUF882 domain-containing protein [Xanthobacteraceae bacterium]|nr:DUF882 domain-containing protein [Xanthobacteraceae bacterium]